MESIYRESWWPYLQGCNGDTDRLMDKGSRGVGGEGEMDGESNIKALH